MLVRNTGTDTPRESIYSTVWPAKVATTAENQSKSKISLDLADKVCYTKIIESIFRYSMVHGDLHDINCLNYNRYDLLLSLIHREISLFSSIIESKL